MSDKICIGNTAEAFGDLLKLVQKTKRGQEILAHEHTLSQRAFFYGTGDKVLVTPEAVPKELLEHNCRVFGIEVQNVYPRKPTTYLSKWYTREMRSGDLEGASLSAYAPTKSLISFCNKKKVRMEADACSASVQMQRYLDSKIGFRVEMSRLCSEYPQLQIPQGFCCGTLRDAANILCWFYSQQRDAVVKVNHGESGWGLWVMSPALFQSERSMLRAFAECSVSDKVWANSGYVVEEYLTADIRVAGGSPSVEMFIDDSGPHTTYACGQVIHSNRFAGVEVGIGVLTAKVERILDTYAELVGARYHSLGYRGYCDIDFVATSDRALYALETNMRRTGGTHVYDIGQSLLGDDWLRRKYIFSQDTVCLTTSVQPADLLARLAPLLYPVKGEQRGIVITSIHKHTPQFGVVVIDSDKKSAMRMYARMQSLLT